MSHVFKTGDRLVLDLGDEQVATRRRGIDFQLLSPLLLGLLFPFMAAVYFEPETLRHLKLPIWLFLIVMFCICTGLFFYTHHFPGRIAGIVIDREARMMEIVWRNPIATASQLVPFKDISALRVRNEYDADGTPQPIPELVLRSRPAIRLPDATTEEQLRPLRAAIGLG